MTSTLKTLLLASVLLCAGNFAVSSVARAADSLPACFLNDYYGNGEMICICAGQKLVTCLHSNFRKKANQASAIETVRSLQGLACNGLEVSRDCSTDSR